MGGLFLRPCVVFCGRVLDCLGMGCGGRVGRCSRGLFSPRCVGVSILWRWFYCVRCSMPLVFDVCLEDVGDLGECAAPSCLFCPVVGAAVVSGDAHARPIVS